MLNNHISRIASAGASDGNILAYGGFNIWWRNITKKKLPANLYSNREICFARVFSVKLLNDYVRGNQFRKVVHDQSGKDLLSNVLHLFCVKMKQSDSIFEFAERCFNSPAFAVKFFQLIWREVICIQISNKCFIGGI